MSAKAQDRRQFLKHGAALAGLAIGAVRPASGQSNTRAEQLTKGPPNQRTLLDTGGAGDQGTLPYGTRSHYETAVRKDSLTPLADMDGIITPASLHMTRTHGSSPPDIDPQKHRLLIHGMVDRPLFFSLADLKRLPSVSRVHFLMCAGNSYLALQDRLNAKTVQETHGKTGCCEWTGVLLSVLLKEAGVQKGGAWLVAEGTEIKAGKETKKHTASIPMEKAMDDTMVCYSQNGEAVRPEHGYPIRLLCPGWEGIRNVKWLRRIQVVDRPYMTKWESTVYTNLRLDGKARWFQCELEPNSVITRPSGGQQLFGQGFYEITGLAWAGGGAVRRVEVSTDGGKTWKDAQIQQPVHRMAHTRFRFPWTWDGQEAVLMSRCTDEWGDVQPTLAELEKIWGVKNDFWLSTTSRIQHFNACQPWKVTRDGSVHNAMFAS